MRGFVIVIVLLVLSICAVLLLRLLHTEHVESAALARRAAFVEADSRARACLEALRARPDLGCELRQTPVERDEALGPLVIVEASAKGAGVEVRLRQLRYGDQRGPVVRVSR